MISTYVSGSPQDSYKVYVSKWDQMGSDVWIGGRLSVEVMQEHLQCNVTEVRTLIKSLSMIVPRRKKIADFTKLHSAK